MVDCPADRRAMGRIGPAGPGIDRRMSLKVANIRLELDEPEEALPAKVAAKLGRGPDGLGPVRILRKSLDARRHDDLHFIYAAEVELPADGDDGAALAATLGGDVARFEPEHFDWPEAPGSAPLRHRPVVIGAGPAGLFAGYMLALEGYQPIVLERGRDVKDRVADVRKFDGGGAIDAESNYLFGEGGAGTFSDGKLTSRSTGPDVKRVLEIIHDCHGKPSILYDVRPHLGSNRLPLIVRTLRRKLEAAGGEVRFSTRVEDLDWADGTLRGVMTTAGYISADAAVLAVGHSARDTYGMLLRRQIPIEAKAFQFGVRIEQPQAQVNAARHGSFVDHPALGAADYNLNVKAGDRDLFTFCMCAGGYVMGSVSEPGYFSTNGMSESRHGLAVRQQRPGRHDPPRGHREQAPAGRRPLPAKGRAALLHRRRPDLQGPDPARRRLPGRPADQGQGRQQLPARDRAGRPRPDPPAGGDAGAGAWPPRDEQALPRDVPQGCHARRPRVPRQLPRPDPPRRCHPPAPRRRRPLPLRRGGGLRRRDRQRRRRRPPDGPRHHQHLRPPGLTRRIHGGPHPRPRRQANERAVDARDKKRQDEAFNHKSGPRNLSNP